MTNLEPLDVKILKQLLADGRKSFTKIANDLNVSKDIITQHYLKLRQQGVIVGATIQFNYRHFGYQAVATVLVNTDSIHFDEVFSRIKKIPNIHPRQEYVSTYNIRIVITVKNLEELSNLKNKIKRENPINAMSTFVWTAVRNMPENLTLNCPESYQPMLIPVTLNYVTVKIDDIDMKIVKELELDGRIPFCQIGKKIGVTVDTVSRRYSRLKDIGAIKVSVQINPREIGYTAVAYFSIAFLSLKESESALDKLATIPDVSYIAKISGDYDLIVAALVRDIDHVAEIRDRIFKAAAISKVDVQLIKTPTAWPGPLQYISTF